MHLGIRTLILPGESALSNTESPTALSSSFRAPSRANRNRYSGCRGRVGDLAARQPGPWPELDGAVNVMIAFDDIVPTGLTVSGDTIYMAQAGPVPHLPQNSEVYPPSAGRLVLDDLRRESPGRLDVWRESSNVWWYPSRSGRYETRLEIRERPPKNWRCK
jgi:hypothetical protein